MINANLFICTTLNQSRKQLWHVFLFCACAFRLRSFHGIISSGTYLEYIGTCPVSTYSKICNNLPDEINTSLSVLGYTLLLMAKTSNHDQRSELRVLRMIMIKPQRTTETASSVNIVLTLMFFCVEDIFFW